MWPPSWFFPVQLPCNCPSLFLCTWGSTKSCSSPSCITYFLFHLPRLVFQLFLRFQTSVLLRSVLKKLWFYKRSLRQILTFSDLRLLLFRPAVPTPLKRTPKQTGFLGRNYIWSLWRGLGPTYLVLPTVISSHLYSCPIYTCPIYTCPTFFCPTHSYLQGSVSGDFHGPLFAWMERLRLLWWFKNFL